MAGGIESFDIGRVLSRSFGAIAARPLPYFGLAFLLAGVPQGIALAWRMTRDSEDVTSTVVFGALSGSGSMIGTILLQIALTRITLGELADRPTSIAAALGSAVRLFLPVLAITILYGLGCVFAMLLLIVPGMMLYVAWAAAIPAYVEEPIGLTESFGRSRELTRGARWKILAVLAIIWMLVLGVQAPTGAFAAATGTAENPLVSLLSALVGAAGSMVLSTVQATTYAELRAAKEGFGADDLEAIFA